MQFKIIYLIQLICKRYYLIVVHQSLCKTIPERTEEDHVTVFKELGVHTLWKLVIKDKHPPDHSRPLSHFYSTPVFLSLSPPFFQAQISKGYNIL